MNNNDLDQLLKSVPAVRDADEHWNQFPKSVTAKLRWQPKDSLSPAGKPSYLAKILFGWGLGFATACVVAAFFFGFGHNHEGLDAGQLAQARKYYSEIEKLFPNQIQAIVFDRQGPHLVLSDKANVPNSPAFYVKVCSAKGCEGFITFSGQQILVNGDNCEVLADEHGQIMLLGNNRVWSGNQRAGDVRVEARPLAALL